MDNVKLPGPKPKVNKSFPRKRRRRHPAGPLNFRLSQAELEAEEQRSLFDTLVDTLGTLTNPISRKVF